MFRVTESPILPPNPECRDAGGFVSFEGRVRLKNEGQPVILLEYDAFVEMAESEGAALLEEASTKFGLVWVQAIHRIGRLEVGDIAVWIGCAAAHRKEAFLACEFIIDELKRRLPIWKKEHYQGGASEWLNLKSEPNGPELRPSDVFARQIAMPEIGPAGQEALMQAKVLIVGAGGLASSALPYLAAAGVGHLGIVEPDLLEPSNLHRQVLFSSEDIGRSKAQLAAAAVRRIHPFTKVSAFEARLNADNVDQLIGDFDVIVDGTDRFDAKFILNDACQRLGRPLVQASIHRLEGHVQTILPGSPCLRCQWPNQPTDGCVQTCAESGVLGVVPGIFGVLEATEVLKVITGFAEPLWKEQLLLDLREPSMLRIKRTKRAGCICEAAPPWQRTVLPVDWEVTRDQVKQWSRPFICLDLREEWEPRPELELGQKEWRWSPLSKFNRDSIANDSCAIVLVCAHGIRSAALAHQLREQGCLQTFSLLGGVDQ
ncbi:MAG: ThiF family adenylyltransferase [Fimbriimonadaceae bacterium]|nr:ThiF family adenylyltransferase [Fimbriimonadaceae bacterium]